jgi:hypothetical protein
VLNAGVAADALGLGFAASLVAPLTRPAAPAALIGTRWPVTDSFDLMAGLKTAFASGVSLTLGSSARLGFSLRSRGLGMDYTLVMPLSTGLGVSNLVALGWDFGERRPEPPAAIAPPLPGREEAPQPQ